MSHFQLQYNLSTVDVMTEHQMFKLEITPDISFLIEDYL